MVNRYTEHRSRASVDLHVQSGHGGARIVRPLHGSTERRIPAVQHAGRGSAVRILGPNLYQYGRNQPGKQIYPPTSNNYDISLEQRLKGTAISFKFTPFYRSTQNQIQNFFLNQQTGFVSGLNVGQQTSRGFEFQVQDGNFANERLSGMFSFAYTYSTIKYGTLSNGTTIISPINASDPAVQFVHVVLLDSRQRCAVRRWNDAARSAHRNPVVAAPCYSPAGAPEPWRSVAGAVAQPVLERAGKGADQHGSGLPDVQHLPGWNRFVRFGLRCSVRGNAGPQLQASSVGRSRRPCSSKVEPATVRR